MARWQYQGLVEPISLLKETVSLNNWIPVYPDKINGLKRNPYFDVFNLFTVPITPFVSLDKWASEYPDILNIVKRALTVNNQFIYVAPVAPQVYLDKWAPSYPNRVNVKQRVQPIDFTIWQDWTTIDVNFGTVPVTPVNAMEIYFRRYLQDVLSVQTIGPPVIPNPGVETANTLYLRRYLQDPI